MTPFALKTNAKAIFLTLVCVSQAFLFSCNSRKQNSTADMSSLDSIRNTIQGLHQKARMYYSLKALDQLTKLSEQVSAYKGDLSEELSPEEYLFVLLSNPSIESEADSAAIFAAYLSGLSSLPGNWWGTPGTTDTELGKRLTKARGSNKVWAKALSNFDLVPYSGSEIATLASELKWTVADLAAGFLNERHQLPYNWRAPLSQRKIQIEAIRNAVAE